MKPSIALDAHRAEIRVVVETHRARNGRVFGSVAAGRDVEGSDLDILVDPTAETTLFDIGAMRHELRQLLGVPVDVLTPNALPDRFRAAVLAQARPMKSDQARLPDYLGHITEAIERIQRTAAVRDSR